MNQSRFDHLMRTLTSVPSRRDVVFSLAGVGFGLGALSLPDSAEAKKQHKKRKKHPKQKSPLSPPPPAFNVFGCLDVGQPCQGDSTLCCSGICDPGTSTCAGHNADGCTPPANSCAAARPVQCNANVPASLCLLTTGNAGFCSGDLRDPAQHCRVCARDTDCQAEFGPGAACVVFGDACTPICGITGRNACVPPAA